MPRLFQDDDDDLLISWLADSLSLSTFIQKRKRIKLCATIWLKKKKRRPPGVGWWQPIHPWQSPGHQLFLYYFSSSSSSSLTLCCEAFWLISLELRVINISSLQLPTFKEERKKEGAREGETIFFFFLFFQWSSTGKRHFTTLAIEMLCFFFFSALLLHTEIITAVSPASFLRTQGSYSHYSTYSILKKKKKKKKKKKNENLQLNKWQSNNKFRKKKLLKLRDILVIKYYPYPLGYIFIYSTVGGKRFSHAKTRCAAIGIDLIPRLHEMMIRWWDAVCVFCFPFFYYYMVAFYENLQANEIRKLAPYGNNSRSSERCHTRRRVH